MNIFVTGATGLVGSHLIYDLLQKGYRVKALKRPQSNVLQIQKTFEFLSNGCGQAPPLHDKIEWVEGEILDFQSMSDVIDNCTHVYHAAAVVSFNRKDSAEMMRINVDGTANIVNVCIEKKIPLCHVSSIAALGRPTHSPAGRDGFITEDDYLQTSDGRSAYSCSKYKAEMEVWRGIAEGLLAVIVNPSVILGAGDHTKNSSKFFSQVYKGLRFHTSGVTGFVDARDVSRCMILLMEQECFGKRYILNADNLSYREVFNMIADNLKVKRPAIAAKPWMLNLAYHLSSLTTMITRKKPILTKETLKSAFQQNYYCNEKITKTLNYDFISIEKCIKDTCPFFTTNH